MRLDVLQVAAVSYCGNEYLATGGEELLVEALLKDCFKGVEALEFRKAHTHHFAAPGAGFIEGAKMWYRRLHAEGVEEIRLHLPLSLVSENPPAWGLVTDADAGCDIWVPRVVTSYRPVGTRVEFNAQRFTPWNMRPQLKAEAALEGLVDAWQALKDAEPRVETKLASIAEKELRLLAAQSPHAYMFEDIMPAGYCGVRKAACAGAVRAVVMISGVEMNSPLFVPVAAHVEAIWQRAMRCFESTRAEGAALAA